MKLPSRKPPAGKYTTFALFPTRMENGMWVWLEWYCYWFKSYDVPGCPMFKIKEANE